MKLIIDMDEDTYKYMQSRCKYQNKGDKGLSKFEEAGVAIKNGTPLPKGHGRIADMDEAIKCIADVKGKDAIWAISLIEWACAKRTIIEADKVESEDKECIKNS